MTTLQFIVVEADPNALSIHLNLKAEWIFISPVNVLISAVFLKMLGISKMVKLMDTDSKSSSDYVMPPLVSL